MITHRPHAFVTGGNGAIGSCLAHELVREGCRVTITGRNKASLEAVAKDCPDITVKVADITNAAEMSEVVNDIWPVDLAVLNAGAYQPGKTSETDLDGFQQMMDVNYFGVLNCLLPLMDKMKTDGGHIAVVGSLAGYVGLPNSAGYGASKAAVISLCESLHAELRGGPVKLQLISPGFVKSKLTAKNDFEMPELLTPEEAADFIIEGLKSDRFEIAFPKKFSRKMKFLQLLPYSSYFPLIKKYTG